MLTLEDLLAGIAGTVTITRKENGVQIHIFIPYSEKPKKPKLPKTVEWEPVDLDMAKGLNMLITATSPHAKERTYAQLTKWAEVFKSMRTKDDRTVDEIREVMQFVYLNKEDMFWQSRILSASKLREKFDTLLGQARTRKKGFL